MLFSLKIVCLDASILNGLRGTIFSNFALGKSPGLEIFCEPEAIHYRRINKVVMGNITFYPQDNGCKVVFLERVKPLLYF